MRICRLMSALAHLRAKRRIAVKREHRVRGGAGCFAEGHHEPALMHPGERRRGGQRGGYHGHAAGHVLHHLGRHRVPEVRLIVQQGQPGQRAVQQRQGLVVGHEAMPADQAFRLRGLDPRPRPRVGLADQFHRDPMRAQQPGQLDHLVDAPVRRQVTDIHDPPVIARRRGRDREVVGNVRRVRHHRMRPGEPRDVPVFGQDQVHAPLGDPFRGVDRHRGRGPERTRQPRLGTERGGGVLVHVPDRRRPPAPGGRTSSSSGSWMSSRSAPAARAGREPAGGQRRSGLASPHRARNRPEVEQARAVREKNLEKPLGRCK